MSFTSEIHKNEIQNISSNVKNKKINITKYEAQTNKINKIKTNNILFSVEMLSQELIIANNKEELKYIFLNQLLLLEERKENDRSLSQIKHNIKMLDKDESNLLKCQKGVLRALEKKIHIKSQLDFYLKELDDKIEKIYSRIIYYQQWGDCYFKELNKIKQK